MVLYKTVKILNDYRELNTIELPIARREAHIILILKKVNRIFKSKFLKFH